MLFSNKSIFVNVNGEYFFDFSLVKKSGFRCNIPYNKGVCRDETGIFPHGNWN